MIEGGWEYVWSAYALALGGLVVLTLAVTLGLARWAKRARDLERRP